MNINDRELLARTLQAEAGNQGYGGMLAAGSVIMNRANASGYGDGLRGVILKPGQFSAWNSTTGYAGGEQGQDMANMRASDEAYKAADDLISGGYEDVTGGATHYYNPAISQPKWGQKAGGDWKQIGDHVFGFADAKKKPNPNQAIASDTMRVLGKQPKGLLATAQATDDTESKMIPEEKPKGLLGSLGIQKMVEGAEGEAGQRFFQRDTFKDAAAQMAPLLAAMGSSPALQKATAGIAAQRTEKNARNKSMEYLAGLPGGEEYVRIAEVAGPKAAMQAYLEIRKAPKSTAAQDKIARLKSTGVPENIAIGLVDGRYVARQDEVTGENFVYDVATGQKLFGEQGASEEPIETASTPGIFAGTNVKGATGLSGFGANILNTVVDAFGQGQPADKIAEASTALQTLSTNTMLGMAGEFPGRPSNLTREEIRKMTILPGEISQGPEKALNKANSMIGTIEQSLAAANRVLSGRYSPADKAAAKASVDLLQPLLADYNSLANQLQPTEAKDSSVVVSPDVMTIYEQYTSEVN
jgi:hypothetical protein